MKAIPKFNKSVDRHHRRFIEDERKAFNEGKRNSKHATCEGNLW